MITSIPITVERGVNDAFKFSQETEMVPVLGLVSSQLNGPADDKKKTETKEASSIQDDHHPALLSLLAEELSINPEQIHDFDLCVLE